MSTITTGVALPTGTWTADAAHSRVEFAVDYMTGTFRGSFSPFEASLEVGADGEATLRGSARVADVNVQDENLAAHLQAPEFFDAERTPDITFESTSFAAARDEVKIAGLLEIKGLALPVELTGTIGEPLTDPFGRERIGLRLDGQIDRTAFGIDWNNPLPTGEPALANEVKLAAELYLVKA